MALQDGSLPQVKSSGYDTSQWFGIDFGKSEVSKLWPVLVDGRLCKVVHS